MNHSSNNTFVDDQFDRLATKRTDKQWLEAVLSSGGKARILPVWQQRCPVLENNVRFAVRDDVASSLNSDPSHTPILLGGTEEEPIFALDVGVDATPPDEFSDWEFRDLRSLATLLDHRSSALIAYAQAMVLWHRNHRHCGRCGSPTRAGEGGHVRECSGEYADKTSCNGRSFPRTDPAIIVLAHRDDSILLGRQASWPPGRYSTIAGFVEPGESLENAVRREVGEETGHVADEVEYFASQPWPFPASLMLGFFARVSSEASLPTDEELEDVRWFSRQQILAQESAGPPLLPPSISIAYRLVEHWFNQDSEQTLAELLANNGPADW